MNIIIMKNSKRGEWFNSALEWHYTSGHWCLDDGLWQVHLTTIEHGDSGGHFFVFHKYDQNRDLVPFHKSDITTLQDAATQSELYLANFIINNTNNIVLRQRDLAKQVADTIFEFYGQHKPKSLIPTQLTLF